MHEGRLLLAPAWFAPPRCLHLHATTPAEKAIFSAKPTSCMTFLLHDQLQLQVNGFSSPTTPPAWLCLEVLATARETSSTGHSPHAQTETAPRLVHARHHALAQNTLLQQLGHPSHTLQKPVPCWPLTAHIVTSLPDCHVHASPSCSRSLPRQSTGRTPQPNGPWLDPPCLWLDPAVHGQASTPNTPLAVCMTPAARPCHS